VVRRILFASVALAPVVIVVHYAAHPGYVVDFTLAAVALVPLAWLIGEATEHAAEHTGPGIGGFLNASFGNAPELIIALFAVGAGLPNVVRGSIAGSIVSNTLLVLGFSLVLTRKEELDRKSLGAHLGVVLLATLLFLIPSVPGWHGNPERHSLAVATIPVAVVLLVVYAVYTWWSLRRHAREHRETEHTPSVGGWSLRLALVVLGVATVLTALVSEILVHSIDKFASSAGLSEFFVAAVIVAIVGNAAEHGGAVVIARRGKIRLASEIAISSSAQVALLVTPAVALLSWAVSPALPLTFRPIELAAIAGATLLAAILIGDGKGKRWEGAVLIGAFVAMAVGFGLAGDR
jgi:Ca2+:H+ antiporter